MSKELKDFHNEVDVMLGEVTDNVDEANKPHHTVAKKNGWFGVICHACGHISKVKIRSKISIETDAWSTPADCIEPGFIMTCPFCDCKMLINGLGDFIDINVVDVLNELNRKGYKTDFSCEGHISQYWDDEDLTVKEDYSFMYINIDYYGRFHNREDEKQKTQEAITNLRNVGIVSQEEKSDIPFYLDTDRGCIAIRPRIKPDDMEEEWTKHKAEFLGMLEELVHKLPVIDMSSGIKIPPIALR